MTPFISSLWNDELRAAVELLRKRICDDEIDMGPTFKEVAITTSGLPVYCDMGGCLMLTPDGDVMELAHDRPEMPKVADEYWREVALVAAGKRYAELRCLRPERPANAAECEACGGSGEVLGIAGCGRCWGKGWL